VPVPASSAGCSGRTSTKRNLQFFFVSCLLAAVAGTALNIYLSSPRAAWWSLAACVSGFDASALDLGPVPDVARHELFRPLALLRAGSFWRASPTVTVGHAPQNNCCTTRRFSYRPDRV
jgi:hypothetical protein